MENTNVLESFIDKHKRRADDYRLIIEDMLGDFSSYGYAESTLIGILNFIEDNNSITDAQVQAVENIRDKPRTRRYGR